MTGFGLALHAEWTKFRTVRGRVVALFLAAAVILALGLLPSGGGSCGKNGADRACTLPLGPDKQQVTDSFTFVHQSLTGDGSIIVRVSSLTGQLPPDPKDAGGSAKGTSGTGGRAPGGTDVHARPGVMPWAKAGLIIKASTRQGSAYAAVMVTGSHGVRMQYNYSHDVAGRPGAVTTTSPRWLRLTRAGDRVTGAESTDGTHWTTVGTAQLAGLPATVQAGMLTTSPQYAKAVSEGLGAGSMSAPTLATATFDQVAHQGGWASGSWTRDKIGGTDNDPTGRLQSGPNQAKAAGTGSGFTVSGSGDIAPAAAGAAGLGTTIAQTLIGTFAGLIAMLVVGTTFITTEYRRGLIRTTLTATPRRGRVLTAKVVVLAAVCFLTGLVAAALVVALGVPLLRSHGVYVHPVTALTELRVIAGTAALLAVAAVLALAVGVLTRRSAAAITTVIVLTVMPYLLALTILPANAADWLLRITPAAAFAIQQTSPRFAQVDNIYTPVNGYFPLAPWAGLGVLGVWTALALVLAAVRFRRSEG